MGKMQAVVDSQMTDKQCTTIVAAIRDKGYAVFCSSIVDVDFMKNEKLLGWNVCTIKEGEGIVVSFDKSLLKNLKDTLARL